MKAVFTTTVDPQMKVDFGRRPYADTFRHLGLVLYIYAYPCQTPLEIDQTSDFLMYFILTIMLTE